MALYILGSSNDDKGTQLEKLTFRLLENLGFTNIVCNEIGSGGHEIDVRAEYSLQGLGGVEKRPIVCECKAHRNPTSMSDWLKFLGKVLLEEQRGNVDAYFIALSGVNGNVSGNYRDLQHSKNNIRLITGESLVERLSEIFTLKPAAEIELIINNFTRRTQTEISHCYYELEMFYLVGFSENQYTLVSNAVCYWVCNKLKNLPN